ncbi:hypothetical protein VTJ83DRAFT_1820 [Remersonia thermophila]|uniref:Stress-response A/B barrel domain-containing protein n=1 Tax=Remersonia thermophila TaxID=72144 RepID=A0ABR4DH85_9PEZI
MKQLLSLLGTEREVRCLLGQVPRYISWSKETLSEHLSFLFVVCVAHPSRSPPRYQPPIVPNPAAATRASLEDKTAMAARETIHRVTLFKIPDLEGRQTLIAAYKTLSESHIKACDGKPYILAASAGEILDDARSAGYTALGHTVFASQEDMEYFDKECPAHTALKEKVAPLVTERPLVVNEKRSA